MRGPACVGLAMAVLALTPAAALAVPRYASPSGGGDCSTPAQACGVTMAVNGADTGDEVTLAPGTYGSPLRITTVLDVTKANVRIQGTAGQPPPRVLLDISDSRSVVLEMPGDRLSRVELDNASGDGMFLGPGASADRVAVSINANGSTC